MGLKKIKEGVARETIGTEQKIMRYDWTSLGSELPRERKNRKRERRNVSWESLAIFEGATCDRSNGKFSEPTRSTDSSEKASSGRSSSSPSVRLFCEKTKKERLREKAGLIIKAIRRFMRDTFLRRNISDTFAERKSNIQTAQKAPLRPSKGLIPRDVKEMSLRCFLMETYRGMMTNHTYIYTYM